MARSCTHCGGPAEESWNLRPCALPRRRKFWLCQPCDLALNQMVLTFIRAPDAGQLLADYRERKAA